MSTEIKTAEESAKEWFVQNYHTPMDSVPVLYGIYDDGQEDWGNVPIEKVLESYHQWKKEKELSELTDERIEEIVKHSRDPLDFVYEWKILVIGAQALRDHLKQTKTQEG